MIGHRCLLVVACLLGSLAANATVRLGPAAYIGSQQRAAASTYTNDLDVVATSWGYLAAWEERTQIRAARLTKDGLLLDDPSLPVGEGVILGAPASDGSDVLILYASGPADGEYTPRLVRVTASGAVVSVGELPRWPRAIVWTGQAYLVFIGTCAPREVLTLDRQGAVIASQAFRIAAQSCEPLAPMIYRDAAGVFQLIYQGTGLNFEYVTLRIALTDANGTPVSNAEPEPLDPAFDAHYTAAIATRDGFMLVSESLVQFADHAGRPIGSRITFGDATFLHANSAGGEPIVAGVARADQKRVFAWRVSGDGSKTELWPGPATDMRKTLIAVHPSAWGALVFSIDSGAGYSRPVPVLSFFSNQRLGSRLRAPMPIARGIPDQRELTATAHGAGMLAVWTQRSPISEVYATLLDARPVGEAFPVARGEKSRVASNGDVALVVVQRENTAAAVRIDRDGHRLDRTPIVLAGGKVRGLAWDGSAFVVHFDPSTAMRVDASGRVLTSTQVPLTNATSVATPTALGVSPHGALFVFVAERVPHDPNTRAMFAQSLTHDLQPVGAPQLISILDAQFDVAMVWAGDHYLVAWPGKDIRATRVSAEGKPLDGDFPPYVGEVRSPLTLARAGSRMILIDRYGVLELDSMTWTNLPASATGELGTLVTTQDGRSWFVRAEINWSGNSALSMPYVREVIFE